MFALALDGGGVKGVLEARVIECLEAAHPFLANVELFAGTSTGGILALALAAGMTPAECVQLYQDNAFEIFASRGFLDTAAGGADEYWRANYGQEGLRKVLVGAFGDRRLPDLDREVLVPTFDISRFRPKFLDRSDDWSLVDAALATSAAPTYFPSHIVRESLTGRATQRGSVRAFIDGGVFANNPSDRAVSFARARFGVPFDEMRLLSIGAGATPYRTPDELLHGDVKSLDWGFRQWVVKQPHLLLKVLFDGSVTAAHFACKSLLAERYYRIQPTLPEDVDLAAADKVPLLLAVADAMELDEAVAWLKLHSGAPGLTAPAAPQG